MNGTEGWEPLPLVPLNLQSKQGLRNKIMANKIDSTPSIVPEPSEGKKETGIQSLPTELMIEIFLKLDLESLYKGATLTCKLWNALSKDCALIRNLFIKTFPESAKTLPLNNLDENFLLQSLIADARMRSQSKKIKPSLIKIKPTGYSYSCLKLINGKIFAGERIGTIKVFDSGTGKQIKKLKGHTFYPTVIKMFDGKLFSASYDATIRIWDFEKGETLKVLEGHKKTIIKLDVYSGNPISASSDKTIRLWDINTGKEIKVLPSPRCSFRLSDGKIFSVAHDKFYIWDAKTGEEIKVIEYPYPVKNFIAAKGKLFIASKNFFHRLDIETNELKTIEGHKNSVTTLTESNGKLFSGSKDWTIRVWDIETGKELKKLKGHRDEISRLRVLDNTLLSYSQGIRFPGKECDQTTLLWDIETGKKLRKFDIPYESYLADIQLAHGKIIAWSSESIFLLDFNQKPQDPLK